MESHQAWALFFNTIWKFPQDKKADAVFVHGWGDLYEKMIPYAAQLFHASGARLLALDGSPSYTGDGSPGYDFWKKSLVALGVPESAIQGVLPAVHTSDEARSFMALAKKLEISSAYILSVPVHIMRAYLNQVAELTAAEFECRLYPATLKGTDWEEEIVVHSLGNKTADPSAFRIGRLVDECARIMEYRERFLQGEDFRIASIEEGITYLQQL